MGKFVASPVHAAFRYGPQLDAAASSLSPDGAMGTAGTLLWVRLQHEHALVVVRGPSNQVMVDELGRCISSGVRYVAVDLSELTVCSRRMISVLAGASRAVLARDGWLRIVATADCVLTAAGQASLPDVFALYRASSWCLPGETATT